jgi:hypothetical protein
LSSACAIYCLLAPAAAGLLAVVGLDESMPETLESLILVATPVLAIVSLAGGCRHHRQWQPWLWFGGGLTAIASGRFLLHDPVWLETLMVVTGAMLIAGAHIANWRSCCAPPRAIEKA